MILGNILIYKNIEAYDQNKNVVIDFNNHTNNIISVAELDPDNGMSITSLDNVRFENFTNWWNSSLIYNELGHLTRDGQLTKKFINNRKKASEDKLSIKRPKIKPSGAFYGCGISPVDKKMYIENYKSAIRYRRSIDKLINVVTSGFNLILVDKNIDRYDYINADIIECDCYYPHSLIIAEILMNECNRIIEKQNDQFFISFMQVTEETLKDYEEEYQKIFNTNDFNTLF